MSEGVQNCGPISIGVLLLNLKTNKAYTNAHDQDVRVGQDARKTFADSVSTLFRELLDSKADAVLSTARVCGRKVLGEANNGK